jgi:asparagine synthase (glutamine-hydrolysing)
MCGIVGVVQTGGEPAPLDRMRDALQHRGPDDWGTWWSDDRRVGLGHRRLSILDLSPLGHQPMLSADSTAVVTLNGEIYNFAELRETLIAAGHSFQSSSDTEVLLAAYREWGVDFLPRLRGMFAFALYDARERCLLLARDRAGEKPLFIWQAPGRLAFASELKALLEWPAVSKRLDSQALEHYLAFGYVPGERCILAGIHKLPAGHAVRYSLDTARTTTWAYWRLPEAHPDAGVEAEDLVLELDALLAKSVREQLVADVPVGILLSGGVDSSLVTAMAARVSSQPVRTYTVSFPGQGRFDEAPFARLVASHFGTKHTELEAEAASVDLLPALARQYDEPIADSSMVPTYLVSRLVRQSCTVGLGGDGGDELFGGYHLYNVLLAQQAVRGLMPAPARRGVSALAARLPVGFRGRTYLAGLDAAPLTAVGRTGLYLDEPTRRALVPLLRGLPSGEPEAFRAARAAEGPTLVQQVTRADFGSYMVDDILVKVDRASMLTALEMRAPFLDHRIIEFAFGRVPDRLKATVRRRKVLLRLLARRVLPPALDVTRKRGFSLPLKAWMRGPWGEFMRETIRSAEPGLFDQDMVERLFAGQARGLSNHQRLFALTMLELWRRQYGVQLPGGN